MNMLSRISEQIQKHPIIVLVLFIIGTSSTIIGLMLDWSEFYDKFLSVELLIPVWVVFVLFFFLLCLIVYLSRPRGYKPMEMRDYKVYEKKKFHFEDVEIDGATFLGCEFKGSHLIYRGKEGFTMGHCTFIGPPMVRFEDAAATTMKALKMMNSDPLFIPIFEKTFDVTLNKKTQTLK